MIFGDKILAYWDDIMRDLDTMIAIPSVSSSPSGNYPFGTQAAKAVDAAMEMAQRYGLAAKNVDYYAMHAQYGEGEENAVVMAHIDVVPAGSGWDTDPFTLTVQDGKAIGRGVLDDKGSAIIALHCLRALKDAGIVGKRKLRVVLGSSEETGMEDMEYYFAREQHPDMGFTPDGAYGVCNCEKGILRYEAKCENDSSVILSFQSGTVANAVPDKAACTLRCSDMEYAQLAQAAAEAPITFSLTRTQDGVKILATGAAAHASTPQAGINAATHLVAFLYPIFGERLGTLLCHIKNKIGLCLDGSKIGVAMSDTDSGELTYNLGIVAIDPETCSLTVDIRYPATKTGSDIVAVLQKNTADDGLTFFLDSDSAPLYVPKDHPLIQTLSTAYTNVTGEPCDIYSMGGGTYARQMFGNGVAFGPEFPQNPDGEPHTANEFAYLENMKLHAQICLEAMYLLFTEDMK